MPRLVQKNVKHSKIRSTLRVIIEGNIENRICYCIQIDYDDGNEEVEEENEEEEEKKEGEEEEKIQCTGRQLFNIALALLDYNEI